MVFGFRLDPNLRVEPVADKKNCCQLMVQKMGVFLSINTYGHTALALFQFSFLIAHVKLTCLIYFLRLHVMIEVTNSPPLRPQPS